MEVPCSRRGDDARPGGVAWLAGVVASLRLGSDRRGRPAAWLVDAAGATVVCLGYAEAGRWYVVSRRGGPPPSCPFPATEAAGGLLAELSGLARRLPRPPVGVAFVDEPLIFRLREDES